MLGLEWILPLFPAQPKLGPVLHNVTQFIPTGFPLLIVVPALALDLLWPRTANWMALSLRQGRPLPASPLSAILVAVQWPFADVSAIHLSAQNPIFGSEYTGYFQGPQSFLRAEQGSCRNRADALMQRPSRSSALCNRLRRSSAWLREIG